jgi:hypothetical protein
MLDFRVLYEQKEGLVPNEQAAGPLNPASRQVIDCGWLELVEPTSVESTQPLLTHQGKVEVLR